MIRVEGTVEINSSVEQVWKFMTNAANATKWDTGIIEARQISDGPVGLGTTVEAVSEARGKRRTMKVEVTEFDLNKKVAWKILVPGLGTGKAIYRFEALDHGTKLSKTSELELNRFFKLFTPIIRRRLSEDEIDLDLNNIKHYVEDTA